jgi:multidrug efflux pump subunit AcrA (membrane-fusion protein)
VIALAAGGLKAMSLTRLKTMAAVVLVFGLLLVGGTLSQHVLEAAPQQEANQDKSGKPAEAPKLGQEAKEGPVIVWVTTPLPGGLERTTMQPGTFHAMDDARIFASISGTLKSQTVDIGDRVKRGEVLAEIDAPSLALEEKQAAVAIKQAKGLVQEAAARCTQARAELDGSKAIVHEKEAALASAKALTTFRQQQRERVKELQVSKSVEQAVVEEKEHQLKAASAQAEAAAAALANARADVKVKESKLARADARLEMAALAWRCLNWALRKRANPAVLPGSWRLSMAL